jgi:hypothetical protein
MDYPVQVENETIKLQPDKMLPDQLYHCLFDGKVFLFYKEEELLNCYEIEDPAIVHEISTDPSNIENILEKYSNSDSASL